METPNFTIMQYDYIIVGQGLAGTVLHYTLQKSNIKAFVISDDEQNMSSKVAAGLYNPVTGRRTVKTWKADDLFPFLKEFYASMEEELGISVLKERTIYKPFSDVSDQNDIASKSASDKYDGYLKVDWEGKRYAPYIHCENGGVEILKGGNLNTEPFLRAYKEHLEAQGLLLHTLFDYSKLKIEDNSVRYEGISAQKVIFCEGHRAVKNPYFSWLPFVLTKGEVLELEIKDFTGERIFNKNGFLFSVGEQKYLAGSTYELDADKLPTEKGKKQIEAKLDVLLKKKYTILNQRAGIRPTVKDRRPLLGVHPEQKEVVIFNGLGTKGVSLAPYFADKLCKFLISNSDLPEEVNISRYFSLYFEAKSAS